MSACARRNECSPGDSLRRARDRPKPTPLSDSSSPGAVLAVALDALDALLAMRQGGLLDEQEFFRFKEFAERR